MMTLNSDLLEYQKKAVSKLIKLKVGALFMEQGTGKTVTTLELARRRLAANKIEHVVWLCPCSAKDNIKREIIKHCSVDMQKVFTICGIETLSTSIKANSYLLDLANKKKCFLVIDESLFVKNPGAYRTKNIKKLAKECQYRIILNGTPISKNEADLFAQFYLLDWRILGYQSYWSFSANHLEYDDYGNLRRVLNTDYLAEKIAPYTFQILKSECLTLPDKIYDTVYFNLTEEQFIEYQHVADVLLLQINEWRPETVYRLFSALQAVISGKKVQFNESHSHFYTSEFFDNPMKNPRIRTVLDYLDDDKTIIFCRYESEVSQLVEILGDTAVRFDGKIAQKLRGKALNSFAKDKKYLIANPNCAGYSLNLQFCHKIINMSNTWDLGSRLQSEDRVHRIGQNYDIEIIDVCAEGTLDEQILKCLRRKENLLDSIKDSIKTQSRLNQDSIKGVGKLQLHEILKQSIFGSKYQQGILDLEELNGKSI